MTKIRIHGLPEELEKLEAYLHRLSERGDFEILSESGRYRDRGGSKYERRYLEITLKETGK